jgi:hypothetical protein
VQDDAEAVFVSAVDRLGIESDRIQVWGQP